MSAIGFDAGGLYGGYFSLILDGVIVQVAILVMNTDLIPLVSTGLFCLILTVKSSVDLSDNGSPNV